MVSRPQSKWSGAELSCSPQSDSPEAKGEPENLALSGNRRAQYAYRLPRGLVIGAAVAFISVGILYAFVMVFGQFRPYDDEGRLMIAVQGYLHGNPLYDTVGSRYGPVYFLYQWVLHGVAFVPLTNDATGILCVINWVLGAALLGFASARLTGSVVLAFFVFVEACIHLELLSNEPGHPQELIVLLLGLAALLAAGGTKRPSVLPLLGAIGGCLLLTKINVGGFFGLALGMSLLCCKQEVRLMRLGLWGVICVGAVVPLLLMYPHLREGWARHFSWETAASILAVGIAGCRAHSKPTIHLTDWLRTAAGSVSVIVLVITLLVLNGSTLSGVVGSLIWGALNTGSSFYIPVRVTHSIWAAGVALLFAIGVVTPKGRGPYWRALVCAGKAVFGILGTIVLIHDPRAQLDYILPWVWLALVDTSERASTCFQDSFPRLFLCFAAVWQSLQAYPVAGTQVSVGTLLAVLVCSLCLYDAIGTFMALSALPSRLRRFASADNILGLKAGFVAALFFVFGLVWCQPITVLTQFATMEPLKLPGSQYRRMPADQVNEYRRLSKYLESNCDTFIVVPGFNSLYFWTDKSPPNYFNISGENNLPMDAQQALVVSALKKAKRPLIVLRQIDWPDEVIRGKLNDGPLAQFIRRECAPIDGFDSFQILAPKKVLTAGTNGSGLQSQHGSLQ